MARQYSEIVTEVLEIAGELIIDELRITLVKDGLLLEKGGLVESLEFTIKQNNLQIVGVDYFDDYLAGKPKGIYVPFGRLLAYTKRYRDKKLKNRFRSKKGQFQSNQSIAWLLYRGIFRNGVKPKPYLDRVMQGKEATVADLITDEYAVVIEQTISDLAT